MSESKRATVAEASPSPEPEQQTTQGETTVIDAPPLPDEPEPESTAPPLPEEPEPEPEPDSREQETTGQDDEVWDPAAETDLKGRKAVEEKKAGDQNDTGGWQAVWAPTANGKSLSGFLEACMRAGS